MVLAQQLKHYRMGTIRALSVYAAHLQRRERPYQDAFFSAMCCSTVQKRLCKNTEASVGCNKVGVSALTCTDECLWYGMRQLNRAPVNDDLVASGIF